MANDNNELENQIKIQTKDYRQLENTFKKICLINVKLDKNIETENELKNFRIKKREEEIKKLSNEKYIKKVLNEHDFLRLSEIIQMSYSGIKLNIRK